MQAIEELEKVIARLLRLREAEPVLQLYQDNPYPCLHFDRAIRNIKSALYALKRQVREKEEMCKP